MAQRLGRVSTLVCVALAVGADGLAGQGVGGLAGVVVDDATLAPIEGATVSLDGGDTQRTNDGGEFAIWGIPGGQVILRIQREGYVTSVESLEIHPSEASLLQIRLQRLGAVLGRLLVEGDGTDARSRGHTEAVLTADDPSLATAADVLMQRVPGLSVARTSGGTGSGLSVRLRGVSSIELSSQPLIYLDGIRIDAGGTEQAMQALDQIPASSVRRIRILRGPASTSRYPDSAAGVILVETFDGGPGRDG